MAAAFHPDLETDDEKREREAKRMAKRAYLEALPSYPNFVLPNDDVDGLLPSTKVKSWDELLKILQGPDFKKTKNDLVYRGHAGHDWELASTLGRMFENRNIPTEKRRKMLRQFKLSMRGRGYDLTPLQNSDNEIWAVGQHHGLKTPLLDWTRSPFVALFFAFSKFESDDETVNNPSRAIFCLNKTNIEEDLGEEFADELFLEPEDHRNSRLVNQSGLFTVAPDEYDNLVSSIVRTLDDNDLLASVDDTYSSSERNEETQQIDAMLEKAWVENQAKAESENPHFSFAVSERKRANLLARYIFKLHIPNSVEDRKDCLEALRQMNIHHGNLFPDPGGASDFCNDWLERLLADEDHEKEEEIRTKEDLKVAAAVTAKPVEDVTGDVKTILEAFLEFRSGDAEELAKDIDRSVEEASSLDWQKFASKRILVKRSIKQSIARGPGDIKAGRKVGELIDCLLDKYQRTASKGGFA